MITIPPAAVPTAGVTTPSADEGTQPANGAPANAHTDSPANTAGTSDPLAKLGLLDLHSAVQSFAAPKHSDADPWLTRHAPQGAGIPLHQKQAGGPQGQPQAAPIKPGAPIDIRQMEALNAKVQAYRINGSPLDPDDLKETKRKFQGATDALKKGDYATAEKALRSLGFPLPAPNSGERLDHNAAVTAVMLGVSAKENSRGGWDMAHVTWGKGGNQALNDVNGFTANAIMMNRLSSLPGGVSNPPTEAQLTQYMHDLANPPKGTKPPTTQELMKAASELTNGFIVHYSSVAGVKNPNYDANPGQHYYYKDKSGAIHEFDSLAAAQNAAKQGKPERVGQYIPVIAKSPDTWSDVTSQGTRAGRHVGDCESKLFMQTRLLTSAGFQSLGAVHVHPKDNSSGHMLGVFKAKDGTIWVTSNEEFRQVHPADKGKGVQQSDVDRVVKEMTAEIYKIQPNYRGEIDLSDYTLATAATASLTGPNAATDVIRRSTELNQLGKSETLIPPPKTPER